jgi:hypothetical protein
MKNQIKLLMVVFGLTLVTSGCVEGGESTEAGTTAVSVNDFSMSPSTIQSGGTAVLEMELQNTGDNDVRDPEALIFGRTINRPGNTWETTDGEPPIMQFRRLRAGTDQTTSVGVPRSLELTAPEVDDSQTIDGVFNAKIFYRYNSTATSSITVMTNERRIEENPTREAITTRNDDGPVHVSINEFSPIITYKDDDSQNLGLQIQIQNKGPGTVYSSEAPFPSSGSPEEREEHEGKVRVNLEDAPPIYFEENTKTIEMRDNSEGSAFFDMNVERPGNFEDTNDINVNLEYSYSKETSTPFIVEGRLN